MLDLVVDDEGDDLTDADRRVLHAALDQSLDSFKAGPMPRLSRLTIGGAPTVLQRGQAPQF